MRREERLFRFSDAEQEATFRSLSSLLEGEHDVAFAYIHGSFATGGAFHDIDLAVMLEDRQPPKDASWRILELIADVEAALAETQGESSPPVDVRALNEAPLGFCYHVLLRGRLIVSRDESLRTNWVVRTWSRYLDLKPLRDCALKEAMTSWR